MKKTRLVIWLIGFLVFGVNCSLAPVEHGVYVQLHPGNSKKIVIQIVPDKTYANVVAYINFYAANNKRVAQKAYRLSDDKDKYVRKDKVTEKVFKFSFDEKVARVTIDHVNEDEVPDQPNRENKGKKINLPVSDNPLGPIGK
jgi:hypothetical protein